MKTAVIYCRVSTEDQRENGTSLDSQAEACQRYAEQNDYRVVEVFKESKSGASLNRPMLDQVRDMVRQGVVEAVIFYALDRLSRDETDTLILAREFRNHGCELKCATTAIEDTPQGQLLLSILAAVGRLERAAIRERTVRGKRQKVLYGTILGTRVALYGYSHNDGRYEIVEDEAYWVRRVFEWYLRDGLPLKAIAFRLAELGAPTRSGGNWAASTVRNILLEDAYTGEYWWGKETTAGGCRRARPRSEWVGPISVPPIISRAAHEAALRRIEHNKANSRRHCETEYLLRGRIVCPLCGRRYIGQKAAKKSGTYTYYVCTRRVHNVPGEDCEGPRVSGKKAEEHAWDWVVAHLSNADLMAKLIVATDDTDRTQRERDEANLRSLHDVQRDLDKELDKLVQLFTADLLSLDQFRERKTALDERKQGVEAQLLEIEERQAARAQAAQDAKSALQLMQEIQRGLSLPLLADELSFDDKRGLLEALHFKASS